MLKNIYYFGTHKLLVKNSQGCFIYMYLHLLTFIIVKMYYIYSIY